MIFLDTHIVLWLFQGCQNELSTRAIQSIEKNDLAISPVVMLEIQYLREIGRIKYSPEAIYRYLQEAVGLVQVDVSLLKLVQKGMAVGWTRDPFDRLIVAQSQLARAPLLTRDRTILKNYSKAFW